MARIVKAYPKCGSELALALVEVSDEILCSSRHLVNLVAFESAYTFSPSERNGSSNAIGLWQFMPLTARRLGTTAEHLASLTGPAQARWGRYYMDEVQFGRWPDDPRVYPLDTFESCCMTVFFPLARGWFPDRRFPANVRKWNPGINTPGDYYRAVVKRARL